MSINLLKRMESSVHSFLLTVRRIYDYLYDTSQAIEQFMMDGTGDLDEMRDLSAVADDFDYDDPVSYTHLSEIAAAALRSSSMVCAISLILLM